MLSQPPAQTYDVFKFRCFRFNLIRFLRLPLDISETDLRNSIRRCSANVFADYVARAEQAVAESEGPVEVTVRQSPRTAERTGKRAAAG